MSPLEIIQQVALLLALCFSDVQIEQFEDGSISITACQTGALCDLDWNENRAYMPIVGN